MKEKPKHKTPLLLRILLFFILPYDDLTNLSGDFEELYYRKRITKGRVSAFVWLNYQILISAPGFLLNKIYWGVVMFKNYFKTTVRNLLKHKLNSSINIVGMGVGLAVCFLLLMFIQDELSYDTYHEKAPRVFRLLNNDVMWRSPIEAALLKNNFPEIEEAARLLPRNKRQIQYEDKVFMETKFAFADASLFKIFSFNFLRGEPETALKQPYSIVITDEIADKYFGSENPIGKTIRVGNEYDYTVSGVIENIPNNSHFKFDFFATLENAEDIFGDFIYNIGWGNFPTYVLLKENVSTAPLEQKFTKIFKDYLAERSIDAEINMTLMNIRDIHLYSSNPRRDMDPQSSITYVIIFASIAVFILLIACFNYINILTANATSRLKEVGIKKVVGATRRQLINQFILEAVFQLVIALGLAILFVVLSLPYFNSFTSKELVIENLLVSGNVAGIIGIIITTVLIAGGYPAKYISSFRPTAILTGLKSIGGSKYNFKRVLVITQFTISIILTVCAVIMFRQLGFLYQSDLGYDKEFVIMSDVIDPENHQEYESLKQSLLKHNNITMVSSANRVPAGELNNYSGFHTHENSEEVSMAIVHTNYDYFNIFGLKPVMGRFFSENLKTDEEESIILNESAVKTLNLGDDPIGNSVYFNWVDDYRTVVGVVKDFYFESLYAEIAPTAFVVQPSWCSKLIVKIKPGNIPQTLQFIEDTWKNIYPEWVFEYRFVDERYEAEYSADQRTFKLMGYFTFLAIFIAALGLFGLVSLSTKNRIKEIGIRKVLGSPVTKILSLITKEYIKWIIVAFIIAAPIAYYFMSRWLQNFAYQITISWYDFAMAGVFTIVIAVLTVGWRSLKAARANPVESLRYE
ncbi:ABC transporter permease [Bacteroidota bacterium]